MREIWLLIACAPQHVYALSMLKALQSLCIEHLCPRGLLPHIAQDVDRVALLFWALCVWGRPVWACASASCNHCLLFQRRLIRDAGAHANALCSSRSQSYLH